MAQLETEDTNALMLTNMLIRFLFVRKVTIGLNQTIKTVFSLKDLCQFSWAKHTSLHIAPASALEISHHGELSYIRLHNHLTRGIISC